MDLRVHRGSGVSWSLPKRGSQSGGLGFFAPRMTPRIIRKSSRSWSRCHFASMFAVASAKTAASGSIEAGSFGRAYNSDRFGSGVVCRGRSAGGVTDGVRSAGSLTQAEPPSTLWARLRSLRFSPRVRGSRVPSPRKFTRFEVVPPVLVNLAPGGLCPGNTRTQSIHPCSLASLRTLATLFRWGFRPFLWTIRLADSRSVSHELSNPAICPTTSAINADAPLPRASPAAFAARSCNDPKYPLEVNWPTPLGQRAMTLGLVTMPIGWLPVGKSAPQTRRWARIVTRNHA